MHTKKQSKPPSTFSLALRLFMAYALFHLALVSCTPMTPTPPQNNGPAFVINSPSEGSSVSGATFFSVQPFNAGEVQSVSFTANGTELTVDAPGEDTFKVFLIPREFPDGELTLSAVVTGKDGSRSEKSIKVNVIGSPPSSATVTKEGALLGTQEESGAVSTLTIPGGAAEGASVNFEARTKAEVKAETGVDYDALGVTFLGAQKISSSQTFNTPLGVSSGGFGPMVQPSQVVVNYTIAPDGDGDGIGELMVINTASVAPNGDVISDPVPQIQLGSATATDGSGTQTLRSLQTGTLSGPPGTFIEIEATGFNQFSAFGNIALVKSLVNGTEVELPALVNNHYEQQNPVPTIGFYIPPLPAGSATVTLKNVGAGTSIAPITITVETPPALTKEPAVIIDESFAEAIRVLSKNPDLQDAVSQLETVRSNFVTLSSNPTPEEAKVLNDIAVFISNSNVNDLLSQIESGGSSGLRAQACSLPGILVSGAMAGYGVVISTLAGIIALTAVITGPLALLLLGVAALGGTAIGAGLSTLLIQIYECLNPPPVIAPGTCLPPLTPLGSILPTPAPIPSPGGPDGIRAQQITPPSPITGMGSVVPPGGDSCGSAVGGDSGGTFGLRSSSLQSQSTGLSSLFGDLAGRFIIKVFYGAGNSVPFTGVSDSSGYFYIPLIPARQPFEAIAFDTLTKETRKFEGTGPEVGQSTYMFFDFLNKGESGAKVISYDTHTQGVYGGVDTYFFEGKAGDIINLAWFTEGGNLGTIVNELSDPNGQTISGHLNSGGFSDETGIVELPLDGLYSFTLDGTQTTGNYTLGLAKIKPPTPIDFTAPLVGNITTLGDREFYSFTGNAGDVLNVTLSAPVMNVTLQGTEPDPTHPFYQQLSSRFLLLFTLRNRNQHSSSFSKTLTKDGDYVLELFNDYPFDEQMQTYLGTYQVDISLTH
jgi:hypothetical protein